MTRRLPMLAACVLCYVLLFPTFQAFAQDHGAVFARLKDLAAGVDTIQSAFSQEKHLALFKHMVRSTGRLAYRRPDSLRWEYIEPSRMGFSMAGSRGRQWDAASGLDKDFDLASDPVMAVVSEQLFAWAAFDLDALRRKYTIAIRGDSPVRLRLEPLRTSMREFIDHLDVEFAPDGRSVCRVEIHEQDGDFTRIVFSDTVINAPLPGGTF